MNSALTQEELEQILNQAVQDITERTAGVRLHQGEQSPGEDLCTVHITFDRGFHTSLTVRQDCLRHVSSHPDSGAFQPAGILSWPLRAGGA